jgi:hypothetical protein
VDGAVHHAVAMEAHAADIPAHAGFGFFGQ